MSNRMPLTRHAHKTSQLRTNASLKLVEMKIKLNSHHASLFMLGEITATITNAGTVIALRVRQPPCQ